MARTKKNNKYLNNNENLPITVDIDWTPDLIGELQKCKKDVLYFAENYFHIVNLDEGRQKIKLFEAQKEAITKIVNNRFSIICASRQIGKALKLDTPIPIPNGWTTIGELNDGDIVLDENGNPAKVIKAHDIMLNRKCFKITFENGDEIIADGEHDWWTQTHNDNNYESKKSTENIYNTLYTDDGVLNHRIVLPKQIQHRDSIINKNEYLYITSVEEVPSVPVRCITVDSPKSMFLCGKTFIPTSNTTLMTIVCLWYALFNKDFTIAILANKEDIAKEILERIKLAYEEIPEWLKAGVWDFTKEQVKLTNGSKIVVSTTSVDAIRGKAINLVFMDEFAHVRKEIADDFWKSVIPTTSSSKKSKIVIVSTPKGNNGRFYDVLSNAEKGLNGWASMFIYWHQIPGRDAEWKATQLSLIDNDMDLWNQEYDLIFIENGTSALNGQILEKLKNMCYAPEFSFDFGDYVVWKEYERYHIYVIGVDASEGVGQDASIAQILDITDPSNIEQVALFASNKMQPYVFAEKLNQIARAWGRPFLCIERNKEGGQVVDALVEVHNYDIDNIVHHRMKNDTRNVYQNLGIFCHVNSKYTGIMNLKYYVEQMEAVSLYDMSTVKEFETFLRRENKTWGAKKGHKDDRVMSLIWALFILEKDIAEKYLEVLEYDDTGKPLKIRDPNSDLADMWYHNYSNGEGNRIRNIGITPSPFLMQFGAPRQKPEKEQVFGTGSGWSFV